jgi:DnaK suppressor protein
MVARRRQPYGVGPVEPVRGCDGLGNQRLYEQHGEERGMDKARIRTRLEQERERLQSVRRDLRGDPETTADATSLGELSTYGQHPGDIGTEVFEHEKNVSILEQIEAELSDVDAAMERLEAGEYGRCQACGKQIEPARLEQRPFARFCLEDQQRAEREAGLPGGVQ